MVMRVAVQLDGLQCCLWSMTRGVKLVECSDGMLSKWRYPMQ